MAEFPYSPGLYKLSHQGKQLLPHSRTFPETSLKSCCNFRKILRTRSNLSRSRIQMFGGHMKRIEIMGTAIISLLLAAGVPGHAQQDQPNRKQDRDQKDENRGRPEKPQNRPQPNRGEEPRQAERNRGQMQGEEQQQRQKEAERRREERERDANRQR